MFKTLLIANRGEIACRVIRTAHRLGIRCIALYSDADRQARHVQLADEAWYLGPAEAAQSYLRADKILAIAQEAGAEAVHPGYGFLSENSGFAEACAAAGIAFVGPPVAAIEAMGSKSAAKAIMEDAGVPLVPGYHGEDQSDNRLVSEALTIGFPLLIKAAMGGGGKGMRVVEGPEKLKEGLDAARREAQNAFGDATLLLERYLGSPRHVEVQVFADQQGNCVYLGDRDCSAQRRHQKVVEEAPAPGLSAKLRRAMGEAAVKAAQAIGYVGAGTVEFLLDGNDFYFMEMNTRLQVEHPVTEMVTGQDLVEWQLKVAAGAPLPLTQEQVPCNGHSVEVRIYAEDPYKGFLPQSGPIRLLREPTQGVRIDTGVRQGDEISPFYDPMIAKLIVHGPDRASALGKMARALDQYCLAGIQTNVGFLRRLVSHPAFLAAELNTRFIERHAEALTFEPQWTEHRLALAALALLCFRQQGAQSLRQESHEPGSPWHRADGWRLGSEALIKLNLDIGNIEPLEVLARPQDGGWQLRFHDHQILAQGRLDGDRLQASLDGHQLHLPVWQHGDCVMLFDQGQPFEVREYRSDAQHQAGDEGDLTAPMNGTIVAVPAKAGDQVKAGDTLIVMEAMKMEYAIAAPCDAVVAEVFFQVGDRVNDGAELVRLEDA
ncbi:acetyl/propionyl/methylcrotonyl-CoA carboxylase subunit alpha [Gallaecimonas kandeliae]|uniref:acetyl/propionyl/methylcrotonyl-CoA carboxylase subunit alpha n=1 Tax=Gallaecimonas kandeliae TaxID=3029055 RepID=UPI00264920D1|nr:acetyl/propionyl/methylcrotonyl-CoA carboxylase subunit alpha [Gallaecimonas kandeliae]WKE66833.1 acetyl/propionyl/methylcrotonyl-CoA carboxylase subunit alpha [Gallaecimonas kandeliae]